MNMNKLMAYGNSKIDKNTAIFNLSSGHNCPMKVKCSFGISGKCYAMRTENFRKNTIPYRNRQEAYWNTTTMGVKANEIIKAIGRKEHEVKYFRFNESGDVKNSHDFFEMVYIARKLAEKGIKAYTYTHNLEAVTDFLKTNTFDSLTVNLSIEDSNKEYYNKHKELHSFNKFVGVPKKELKNYGFQCTGVGCMTTCKKCAVEHGKTVYVGIH